MPMSPSMPENGLALIYSHAFPEPIPSYLHLEPYTVHSIISHPTPSASQSSRQHPPLFRLLSVVVVQ